LQGQVAIGHTRYSTTGSSGWSNAQPLVQHGRARTVALGHNGNLVNETVLRDKLTQSGVTLRATSDSEVIAALIANDEAPLEQAVANAMRQLEGAYSIVGLSQGTLIAFRDPHGFRPLVLGRIHDDWVVASETCALDLVGAEFVREVARGEAVLIDENGLRAFRRSSRTEAVRSASSSSSTLRAPTPSCPGSRCTAHAYGWGAARQGGAGRGRPRPADPDSARPRRSASAGERNPFSEGLIKNRYIARTFIQPDQELRRQGVKLKFNPLAEVAGQRVVVVDDLDRPRNTTRQIVQMLFDAGAAQVHVRISSPPVIGQCFYGIDLADPAEMIGADRTVEQIRESHRGDVARLPVARQPRRGDRAARVGAVPRLPYRRLPDGGSGGVREAPLRVGVCSGARRGLPELDAVSVRSGCPAETVRTPAPRRCRRPAPAARSCASIASRSRTR
jgi:amidophosphoribosyltransferase